jgi:hypothetical protein
MITETGGQAVVLREADAAEGSETFIVGQITGAASDVGPDAQTATDR